MCNITLNRSCCTSHLLGPAARPAGLTACPTTVIRSLIATDGTVQNLFCLAGALGSEARLKQSSPSPAYRQQMTSRGAMMSTGGIQVVSNAAPSFQVGTLTQDATEIVVFPSSCLYFSMSAALYEKSTARSCAWPDR